MDCDQILETILVGPVPGGSHMFVFEVTKLYIYRYVLLIIYVVNCNLFRNFYYD